MMGWNGPPRAAAPTSGFLACRRGRTPGRPAICRGIPRGRLRSSGPARPGHRFLSKESGGKERAGGRIPPAPPKTGPTAAAGCTGKAKTGRASTPGSFFCTQQALPRPGRPAPVTPRALTAAALYRPGPPGRHRCNPPETPLRLRHRWDLRRNPAAYAAGPARHSRGRPPGRPAVHWALPGTSPARRPQPVPTTIKAGRLLLTSGPHRRKEDTMK